MRHSSYYSSNLFKFEVW